jgi:hypothetical protein
MLLIKTFFIAYILKVYIRDTIPLYILTTKNFLNYLNNKLEFYILYALNKPYLKVYIIFAYVLYLILGSVDSSVFMLHYTEFSLDNFANDLNTSCLNMNKMNLEYILNNEGGNNEKGNDGGAGNRKGNNGGNNGGGNDGGAGNGGSSSGKEKTQREFCFTCAITENSFETIRAKLASVANDESLEPNQRKIMAAGLSHEETTELKTHLRGVMEKLYRNEAEMERKREIGLYRASCSGNDLWGKLTAGRAIRMMSFRNAGS